MSGFSPAERDHLKSGPFPGRMDPWAEHGHYFQSLHSSMIDNIMAQIQDPLMERGYVVGRETSLQVAAGREPDLFVRRDPQHDSGRMWDYGLAAEEVLAQPGIVVQDRPELEAVHIRDAGSGDLVTVLEIVSPGNKVRDHEMIGYRERRSRVFLERGVQVVEIDATRSVKRLTNNSVTRTTPYHVAIFLPSLRVVEIGFDQPLVRIALPLRADVVPVDLQDAYTVAYQRTTMAWHIQHDNRYTEADLPFPSLLSDDQRRSALAAVNSWQTELERLAHGT
jgi:hypothetical protein